VDELYIKHVIGYRGWDIVCVNDSWYLSSPFRKTIWPYKEPLIMKDDFPNKYIPPKKNTCIQIFTGMDAVGIYSYKKDFYLDDKNTGYINRSIPIWGSVAQWGKIIEHEKGYRSEYCYPLEINKFFCFSCHSDINIKNSYYYIFRGSYPNALICSNLKCNYSFVHTLKHSNFSCIEGYKIIDNIINKYNIQIL